MAIECLIKKMIELAQKCINGSNHATSKVSEDTFYGGATNYNQTGTFSSPGGVAGIGPGGSGPIQNDEEIICDILTEVISTLFKMYTRLLDQKETLVQQKLAELDKQKSQSEKSAQQAAA